MGKGYAMNFTPFHCTLKTFFVVFFKLTAAEQSQQLRMLFFLKDAIFPNLLLKILFIVYRQFQSFSFYHAKLVNN